MFSQFFKKTSRGFTLIEILIVIGIIAILAAIVIIAINPAKQFAQARNTQREAAVNSILNAVGQRIADNKGVFAGSFDSGAEICPTLPLTANAALVTDTQAAANETSGNLGCLVPTYISAIATDPAPDAVLGGYKISVNAQGRVTVCAPSHKEAAIPDSAEYCVTR
jgi:type IV pilus assembly protein PilA